MNDNYPIVLFWSDEDEAWIATMPDLDALSAHGQTPEEAVRELMVAREPWFELHRANGHPLPDPHDSRFWPEPVRERLRDNAALVGVAAKTITAEEAGAA